jgi:hypothetical protein
LWQYFGSERLKPLSIQETDTVANLRKTLQRLMAAKRLTSRLEDRFLKELARQATVAEASTRRTASRRAARRTLKCPRCSRRFARPLHLGRHRAATHCRKRRKAA